MLWSWRPSRKDAAISWAVTAASFMSIFFSMGLSFGSIGVMTVAFGEQFSESSADELSWIGGIRLCFVFLTGIVSSVLVNKFGSRPMQIVGCSLAALSVGITTLMTEVWHLYLTFGALAGAGLSLVFTASSVIVEGHFDKYVHVALPLSQLGDTVGNSVFPVLTQYMLNKIGVRLTLLTFCGLTGVPLLCSVFYFGAVEEGDEPGEAPDMRKSVNGLDRGGHSNSAFTSDNDIVLMAVTRRASDAAVHATVKAGAPSADLSVLPCKCPDTESDTGALPSYTQCVEGPPTNKCPGKSQGKRLLELLARWDVWLLLLNMFSWQYTSSSAFVLLPTFITKSGIISKDDAALGITVIGIANVAGNLVTIFAALRPYNHVLFFATSCLLFGIGAMLYSLAAASAAVYFTLCALNGFWLGILLGLTMSLIYHFGGPGGMTDLFGLVTFASGLGGLAGPGITGVIQTHFGDDVGLYVSGAMSICAFAMLLTPSIKREKDVQPGHSS